MAKQYIYIFRYNCAIMGVCLEATYFSINCFVILINFHLVYASMIIKVDKAIDNLNKIHLNEYYIQIVYPVLIYNDFYKLILNVKRHAPPSHDSIFTFKIFFFYNLF